MNRVILFRGFHPDENGPQEITLNGKKIRGKWVEGDFCRPGNIITEEIGYDPAFEQDHVPIFCDYDVIPETLGQYINIDDKNGKKIFESDAFCMEDDMTAVIIFKDGSFRLQVYGLTGAFTESGYDECGGGYGVIECEPVDWFYINDMRVIGNIFSNPELLESEGRA